MGEPAVQSQGSSGAETQGGQQNAAPPPQPWAGWKPQATPQPQQRSAASGDTNVVNFNEMISRLQGDFSARQEQTETRARQAERRSDESAKTLERIRSALGGDQDGGKSGPTPDDVIGQYESELDQYLAAAVEARSRGQDIPLTTNLAARLFQNLISQTKEKTALEKRLGEIENQLKRATDPGLHLDTQAYSNIDNQVITALETIHGRAEDSLDVRRMQFRALTESIGEEIQRLKKEDPRSWDEIRRDRNAQQKMVRWFVERTIPPRARQILFDDQIQREPMTLQELYQAFHEARNNADADGNPVMPADQQRKVLEDIRGQILSRMFAGEK